MPNFKDLTGQRFGRLVVVSRAPSRRPPSGKPATVWHCRCDCGNEVDMLAATLKCKRVVSCGCFSRENTIARNTTHGQSKTRLYRVYKKMKARCFKPTDPKYPIYGGRGITMCPEWSNDYTAFYEWAVKSGYDPEAPYGKCTIDRIDVNGNYEPGNCRWATMAEQAHNKRRPCGESKV